MCCVPPSAKPQKTSSIVRYSSSTREVEKTFCKYDTTNGRIVSFHVSCKNIRPPCSSFRVNQSTTHSANHHHHHNNSTIVQSATTQQKVLSKVFGESVERMAEQFVYFPRERFEHLSRILVGCSAFVTGVNLIIGLFIHQP